MNTASELHNTIAPRTSGLAIASLVFGIISVLGGLLLIIPPLLSLIFGIIALTHFKKEPTLKGKGMAIAGLVTTGVSLLMIPLIGLLAATAIPVFHKAREKSLETALEKMIINEGRQIGGASKQMFWDTPNQPIVFTIDPATGTVSAPLNQYIRQLSKGTVPVDGVLENDKDGFSLSNPELHKGAVYQFDYEGRLIKGPTPAQR